MYGNKKFKKIFKKKVLKKKKKIAKQKFKDVLTDNI